MSLVGLRDMSVMETPPEARLPIHTEIRPFDDELVRGAIVREMERGGQVYVVHNRVETIERAARRIRNLAPEARVAVAHGQMPEERLERVMRWGKLSDIQNGIAAAEQAGLTPIKLNAVIARGYNDADVAELAALTIERDWHFRFIEMMPFGIGECATVAREQYVSNDEVRARIERQLGTLTPLPGTPSDEAVNFRLPNARGVVGFISPVSAPYCGSCNRMRLTADGKFHLCLLNDDEMDIKAQLRKHGPDAVRAILVKAVQQKPMGHRLHEGVFTQNRRMFQIGG